MYALSMVSKCCSAAGTVLQELGMQHRVMEKTISYLKGKVEEDAQVKLRWQHS